MKHPLIVGVLALAALSVALAAPKSAGTLDDLEATHLTFMRSEEKLARDVYLTLAEIYPDQPAANVFTNIGDGSEQTHTDAVRDMLESYGLPDPNPDANDLPDNIGVFYIEGEFEGGEYGWYFQEKYDALVGLGSVDLLSALYVGAFIEELDMLDIIECPKVILENEDDVDVHNPVCGLNYTDEPSLQNLYNHLVDGSENHLRSFVKNIEKITGDVYEAQVLTQGQVDAILGR